MKSAEQSSNVPVEQYTNYVANAWVLRRQVKREVRVVERHNITSRWILEGTHWHWDWRRERMRMSRFPVRIGGGK